MNLINRMIVSESNPKLNINGTVKGCECENCTTSKVENTTVEYPPLSEEEIERIIKERYDYKDKKTKKFIRKALKKHGDKYDYSNVIYVKCDKKIDIICRVGTHDSFLQTPHKHLNGDGCPKCKSEKLSKLFRMTVEEFIKRAREIHGDKYDYSKVNYKGMKTKIIITCPIHGDFPQTPDSHLHGNGCRKCQYEKLAKINNRKLTLEEFIKQSREIHGDKYDYSKVKYVNINTKVIITCPIHGDFPQTPHSHLNGCGCLKCKSIKISESQRMTKEEFIKRAREIHGDKYDYSKVDYKYIDLKVIITCPIHGDFPQTPNNHLRGSGCSKCNASKGENTIRNYLIQNGFNFEEQKRFNNCRDKKPLPFDFYLPQYNLCIEFDGKQHFMIINFGHMTKEEMEENLKLNQLHDTIKTDYCKINKIHLLRIRYDEDIKKKLSEYFKITENKLSLEK